MKLEDGRCRMRVARVFAVAALAVVMGSAIPRALAQDRERGMPPEEVVHRLEAAIDALHEIGRPDEAESLERVLAEIHERLRREHEEQMAREGREMRERRVESRDRGQPSPELLERQMHALECALDIYVEFGWEDAAGKIERAMHAYRVMMKGREDPEAREIRERAPKHEEVVDLLVQAERVAREHERFELAQEISRLTEEVFASRERRRDPQTERREALAHEIEVMQMAVHGLAEADRHDAAEVLERAVQARRMDLEGRRDRESIEFREQAPGPEDQVELLHHASRIWHEFDQPRKANAIEELADRMRERLERRRVDRERNPEQHAMLVEMHRRMAEQMQLLKEQMHEMERMMDHLAEQIQMMEARDR